MKKIKFSEIRNLEAAELLQRLRQLRRELFDSRMQLKMKRLSNTLTVRFLRRDIARLQTALSQNKALAAPAVKNKSAEKSESAGGAAKKSSSKDKWEALENNRA